MSLNQLFDISRRSFRTLNAAMNTVGQNVANAETEGYARRRVVMRADTLQAPGLLTRLPAGTPTGAGVSIQSIDRMRDGLLMRSGWTSRGSLGFSEEQHRVLGALEGLFPTHSGGSLSDQLAGFWQGWSDLADAPADSGARTALRGKAAGLAGTLRQLDAQIRDLQRETESAVTGAVDEVNGLIDDIHHLNVEITAARRSGSAAFEAEDRRDVLLGKLSEFVPVNVSEREDGELIVRVGGVSVVEQDKVMRLEADRSSGSLEIRFQGTTLELGAAASGSGRLSGLLDTIERALPETIASLDALAQTLVAEVNAVHQTGYGRNGATGVDFFDPSGVTAATIDVSADVLADADAIAASAGDPTVGYNDSSIALSIARLREARLFGGGTATAEGFAIGVVTEIGSSVSQAGSRYEAQAAYTNHLESMERGVSGVSIDEEMTSLIRYQQSFQASARVLNAAQQMMDTLLNL